MKRLIFAGNWKMHHGPESARRLIEAWMPGWRPSAGREAWFFPPAPAIATVAQMLRDHSGCAVGVQNVHWEASGAFTGETSVAIAREAGATLALVGHSERRHVFGETDAECARKVRAVLAGEMTPVLCVGETLTEREAGQTEAVVRRHLSALDGLAGDERARVVIAYEPVWAIGTGRTAKPEDAHEVQRVIRAALMPSQVILYGGSVKPDNVAALVAQPHVNGVLVGGASIDPAQWSAITSATAD
jgi:triosephosphate isomerase